MIGYVSDFLSGYRIELPNFSDEIYDVILRNFKLDSATLPTIQTTRLLCVLTSYPNWFHASVFLKQNDPWKLKKTTPGKSDLINDSSPVHHRHRSPEI